MGFIYLSIYLKEQQQTKIFLPIYFHFTKTFDSYILSLLRLPISPPILFLEP